MMVVADAEAPRPPRIETAVEFWSGMAAGVRMQAVVRMQAAVDTCPERIHAAGLTVRGFFGVQARRGIRRRSKN